MDEIVSINDLAKMLVNKGKTVIVVHEHRGILGRFLNIRRSTRTIHNRELGRFEEHPHPDFWTIAFIKNEPQNGLPMGGEIIPSSYYHRLELVKIDDDVFHLIVPL